MERRQGSMRVGLLLNYRRPLVKSQCINEDAHGSSTVSANTELLGYFAMPINTYLVSSLFPTNLYPLLSGEAFFDPGRRSITSALLL